MSVASTQCHLLMITSRKADLEYRLLQLTNHLSRLASETASLNEELMYQMPSMREQVIDAMGTTDADDVEEALEKMMSDEFYVAYQNQIALIHVQEVRIQAEKTEIETQLKALTTMEEGAQKQLDADLKKAVLQV